jgi:anaerobic selenocysteine-containing dehydrogenase
MCGLEIHVEDDQVALIRADRDDAWSKGHLCPKGTTLGYVHHDPDRLRQPLVREGDSWRAVSWDEAFRRCSELLGPVIEQHGIEAVTAYVGNPLAHNFSLGRYIGILIGMSGIPMIYSAGTVDQWPKNVSSHLMYGGMWKIPVPDIQRTDLLVVMGANPHASQGSLLACPDVMGEIDAIRARGGKVIVIDPRRTGTAAAADEWLAITPGTDAALLLAVANVVVSEGLVRLGHVADLLEGVDHIEALVAEWTPERVAPVTGISADRIRTLAREFATTERAVIYGRIGLCNQEFGTLASWLVDVVNILTGHFDAVGGLMFPRPAVWSVTDLPMPGLEGGVENFGRWKTRVRGASEVLGHVPVSCLAEEIATPGDGQIRALFTVAGNPVLSTPGQRGFGAVDLRQRDCAIERDHRARGGREEQVVALDDLAPVGGFGGRRVAVHGVDRGLNLVLARHVGLQAAPHDGLAFRDQVAVPLGAVLVRQQHPGSIGCGARGASRLVEQEQREQPEYLELVGHQVGEDAREPDRFGAQVGPDELAPSVAV